MNTNTNAALIERLRACESDPMWADHAEVRKSTLRQVIAALSTAAQPPAGMVMVPIELAERVRETMGEFLMDHGWRQQDMDTSDDFGALLAAAPKAAKAEPQVKADASPLNSADPLVKAEPVQQPERVPLPNAEFVAAIEASGFTTWDSRMWELKRHLEAAHGIQPAHKEQP